MRVFFHLNAPNLRLRLCFLFERLKISPDYLFLRQQTYRTFRYRYCFQIICCFVKDFFTCYEVAITVRDFVIPPCPGPLIESPLVVFVSLALRVLILSTNSCLSRCLFLSSGNCHPLKRLCWRLQGSPDHVCAMEHVSSSGSVLCVLLIHLNSRDKNFILQVLFLIRNFLFYIRLPGQTFLSRVLDCELACSPHRSPPRTNNFAPGFDQLPHLPSTGLQR